MAAHVSAVPNHQTGRVTPIATRAAVAFFGVFGYELDPTALDDDERAAVRAQIAFYVRHRDTLQYGRVPSPRRPVRPVTASRRRLDERPPATARRRSSGSTARPQPAQPVVHRVRLRGLDPGREYRVTGLAGRSGRSGRPPQPRRRGSGPSSWPIGLTLDRERHDAARLGDFWSRLFVLEADLERSPAAVAPRGHDTDTDRGRPAGRPRRSGMEDAPVSPWSSRG